MPYDFDLDADVIQMYEKREARSIDESILSSKIKKIIESTDSASKFLYSSDDIERIAANHVLLSDDIGAETPSFAKISHVTFVTGCYTLKLADRYYIFEPCIKRMFDMTEKETKQCVKIHDQYFDSNHETMLNQSYDQANVAENINIDKDLDQINRALDDYIHAMNVVERGFPLLLAVKRVFENGKMPELDELQNMRLSKIQTELTDDSTQAYPYFDLIAEAVDTDLRNAVAHGDVFTDPKKSKVHIENKNIDYTFPEVVEKIKDIMSVNVFLGNTFQSTVPLSIVIQKTDLTTTGILVD